MKYKNEIYKGIRKAYPYKEIEGSLIDFNDGDYAITIDPSIPSWALVRPDSIRKLVGVVNGQKVYDGDKFKFEGSNNEYFVSIECNYKAVCYSTNLYTDLKNEERYRWGDFYRIFDLCLDSKFVLLK